MAVRTAACQSSNWYEGRWRYRPDEANRYPVLSAAGRLAGPVLFDYCFPYAGANCTSGVAYHASEAAAFFHSPGVVLKRPHSSAEAMFAHYQPVASLFTNWADFRQGENRCVGAPRDWRWEPDGCMLETFSARDFCALLGNDGRMLLVGDSIQLQLYSTLRALIIAGQGECWRRIDFKLSINLARPGANVHVPREVDAHGRWPTSGRAGFNNMRWEAGVDADSAGLYRMIVLNSGARSYGLSRMGVDEAHFRRGMASVIEWLRKGESRRRARKQIVVWRGMLPGHANCSESVRPVSPEEPTAPTVNSLYNWALFETFDELAQRALANLSGVQFLNVLPPYLLRPDGHTVSGCLEFNSSCGDEACHCASPCNRDCLHWAGGALDLVVEATFHLMKHEWMSR